MSSMFRYFLNAGQSTDYSASFKSESPLIHIVPINAVNSFMGPVTVKGRVTAKTDLNEWQDDRTSGLVFGFDIQDSTGEIHVVAFRNLAVKWFNQIEVNDVIVISNPWVVKSEQGMTAPLHDYQMIINGETTMTLGDYRDVSCPPIRYNFVKLRNIPFTRPGDIVDVRAVIHEILEPVLIVSTGFVKREILLQDDSLEIVILTLWNTGAERFVGQVGNTVLIRKARVSDAFGPLYLTRSSTFSMVQNPDDEEADRIGYWYDCYYDM